MQGINKRISIASEFVQMIRSRIAGSSHTSMRGVLIGRHFGQRGYEVTHLLFGELTNSLTNDHDKTTNENLKRQIEGITEGHSAPELAYLGDWRVSDKAGEILFSRNKYTFLYDVPQPRQPNSTLILVEFCFTNSEQEVFAVNYKYDEQRSGQHVQGSGIEVVIERSEDSVHDYLKRLASI